MSLANSCGDHGTLERALAARGAGADAIRNPDEMGQGLERLIQELDDASYREQFARPYGEINSVTIAACFLVRARWFRPIALRPFTGS